MGYFEITCLGLNSRLFSVADSSLVVDHLDGLVVKVSASSAAGLGSIPAFLLGRFFSRRSHTSELKIGTLMATLSGAFRYRVSDGTGRPGVSIY